MGATAKAGDEEDFGLKNGCFLARWGVDAEIGKKARQQRLNTARPHMIALQQVFYPSKETQNQNSNDREYLSQM